MEWEGGDVCSLNMPDISTYCNKTLNKISMGTNCRAHVDFLGSGASMDLTGFMKKLSQRYEIIYLYSDNCEYQK